MASLALPQSNAAEIVASSARRSKSPQERRERGACIGADVRWRTPALGSKRPPSPRAARETATPLGKRKFGRLHHYTPNEWTS